MTNETIKRTIKKVLAEKGIVINKIQFQKVVKVNGYTRIGKVALILDSIDGIYIDVLKSTLDNFFAEQNIDCSRYMLDI